MSNIFPRTLYKSGGPFKWGKGKNYSSILVEDEDELKAAIKTGFIDSFQEALFPSKENSELEIAEVDEDLTKPQVIELLKKTTKKFNPRDKKEDLLKILNSED
jgi:hypothetical protein